jgi:biopolymer transport protein TolQ
MAFGLNSAVWQLVKQSDWVSKYIVMLSLTLLSIVCVAIMIHKYLQYREHKKNLQKMLTFLRRAKSLQDLVTIQKEFHLTIGGILVSQSITEIREILEEKRMLLQATEQWSNDSTIDATNLEILINQHIENLILEQETHLPILSTAAAVGPLMGLFGTIWGLIHCFVNISQERSADIATVAPGIAEALITTLAGLIVAIPALIAFNYFTNELRKIESRLIECGELLFILCKKSLSPTQKVPDAKKTASRPTL